MSDHNMDHLKFIRDVAEGDIAYVDKKDRSYGGSWKRRGGVGAFMMLARKWDRLETIVSKPGAFGGVDKDAPAYDLFAWIDREVMIEKKLRHPQIGSDGTVLAEIRDLRRYLLLVEAEMMSRGVLPTDKIIGSRRDEKQKTKHYEDMTVEELCAERERLVAEGKEVLARTKPVAVIDALLRQKQVTRKLSETRVIVDNMIHESGRAPRPAYGVGVDGVQIRVGDQCTCDLLGSESVFETKLIDVQPGTNMPIVEYNGAPGGVVTEWNRLRKLPFQEERRVPRFDPLDTRQRTPEDGAHHAAATPHVVTEHYREAKRIPDNLWELFWTKLGTDTFRLEPHVQSLALPRCLQGFYDLTDAGWVLRASRVPPDARDYFPRLRPEVNAHEYSALPAWQRSLYKWREGENKFVLRERELAWAGEEA